MSAHTHAVLSASTDDLPAAARLLAESLDVDRAADVRAPSAESLRGWAAVSRPFLACVRDADRMSAWAYSMPTPCHRDDRVLQHFRIFVHPDARRRGIATALLHWADALPRRGARPGLQCTIGADWDEARAFLARHAFTLSHEGLTMRRPSAPVPDAVPSVGVTLRPFDPARDTDAWRDVHHTAYRGDVQFHELDAETARCTVERPGFGMTVAEVAGRVVGFCMTREDEGDPPRVESLAVLPGTRRRGLGRALLRAAMATLARRDEPIELDVHAHLPAHALYVSEGFVESSREQTLRRDCSTGIDTGIDTGSATGGAVA